MNKILYITVAIVVALLMLANLFWGSIHIPADTVLQILMGGTPEGHESWRYIVMESRLPQMITATLCGATLASAGLLLQTLFRNPIAGPSILGIDAGANLGVALVILLLGGVISVSGTSFGGQFLIIIAALLGAGSITLLLLSISRWIGNSVMLLIVGVMISYLTSSVIQLLNFHATEQGIQNYVVWGMGNFSGVTLERLPYFALFSLMGILLALLLIKPLDALLLGERYAESLGVNLNITRTLILVATGLEIADSIAFCGPITFIGLATPHIARLISKRATHRTLMPLSMTLGAGICLMCNLISTLPSSGSVIPINILTPIFGAPVILWVLMSNRGNK